MCRPNCCAKCKLLACNEEKYYCRMGAFYDRKTVLKYNVHSNCALKTKQEKMDDAVDTLFSIFSTASKKRKVG